MIKFYILFSLFFLFSFNYSFADCITGYACSLGDLQTQNLQKEKILLKELNDYFELQINEDFILGNITQKLKYKDFFPFSGYYLPDLSNK